MKRSLALLLLVMAFGTGCSRDEPVVTERGEVEVKTAAVEARDVADTMQSVGTVEPKHEAALSARIMGTIKTVTADEGDRVRKGETLVVIDAEDIRAKKSEAEHARQEGLAALKEAEAALENAGINYSRIKSLYEENAVTKKELDDIATQHRMADAKTAQVKARIAQAEAAIRQADVMLGYSVITSPIDGVVVSKSANAGETAAPGMPLLKVVDDNRLRLNTTVKESGVAGLLVGAEVSVSVDSLPGREIKGAVSEIVTAADPATRSFVVKVDLPRVDGLMPGMFARAYLPIGTRAAVVLPEGSLMNMEGIDGVYVVDDEGVIRFQAVRLGGALDGGREVLAGLSGGERVVVGDRSGVVEGMKAVAR